MIYSENMKTLTFTLYPIALIKTKTVYNSGLPEWNRVNYYFPFCFFRLEFRKGEYSISLSLKTQRKLNCLNKKVTSWDTCISKKNKKIVYSKQHLLWKFRYTIFLAISASFLLNAFWSFQWIKWESTSKICSGTPVFLFPRFKWLCELQCRWAFIRWNVALM